MGIVVETSPSGRSTRRLEICLVQDHRARSNQLFSLEAIDLEHRRALPVEAHKTRPNGVEPPQRTAVIVYVMAHEQSL